MRRQLLAIAIAIAAATAVGSQVAIDAAQLGPDVSGRWTREPGAVSQGAGNNAGWGPSVEIEQSGNELTVRSPGRAPAKYKADGGEVTESLSKAPCYQQSRVTKTVATSRSFTITTWLVTRTSCFHGEQRILTDDPETAGNPQGKPAGVTKVLESVTTLSRNGDQLAVDTTTGVPGGTTRASSSTYRK